MNNPRARKAHNSPKGLTRFCSGTARLVGPEALTHETNYGVCDSPHTPQTAAKQLRSCQHRLTSAPRLARRECLRPSEGMIPNPSGLYQNFRRNCQSAGKVRREPCALDPTRCEVAGSRCFVHKLATAYFPTWLIDPRSHIGAPNLRFPSGRIYVSLLDCRLRVPRALCLRFCLFGFRGCSPRLFLCSP
jgi:hypothetical protein